VACIAVLLPPAVSALRLGYIGVRDVTFLKETNIWESAKESRRSMARQDWLTAGLAVVRSILEEQLQIVLPLPSRATDH
jgi:hypothetical protein